MKIVVLLSFDGEVVLVDGGGGGGLLEATGLRFCVGTVVLVVDFGGFVDVVGEDLSRCSCASWCWMVIICCWCC